MCFHKYYDPGSQANLLKNIEKILVHDDDLDKPLLCVLAIAIHSSRCLPYSVRWRTVY